MRKVLEGAGLRHFHSPFSPSPCSGVMAFLVWEEGKTRRAGDDDDNDDSNVLMPVCHVKTTTRWTHCRRFAGRDIRAFERNTTSGSLTTFAEMPRGQTLRREANWAKPRSKTTPLRVEKKKSVYTITDSALGASCKCRPRTSGVWWWCGGVGGTKRKPRRFPSGVTRKEVSGRRWHVVINFALFATTWIAPTTDMEVGEKAQEKSQNKMRSRTSWRVQCLFVLLSAARFKREATVRIVAG